MLIDSEKILVVDDDKTICKFCVQGLKSKGYEAISTSESKNIFDLIKQDSIDLILTDSSVRDPKGNNILRQIKMISPDIAVVVMTAFASTQAAINAVNDGAYSFIPKPVQMDEMIVAVKNALERRKLLKEIIRLKTLVNLFDVTEKINSSLEISQLLNTMIQAVVKETRSEKAIIFYPDEETNELYIRCAVGIDEGQKDQIRIPINSGVYGKIFNSQRNKQLSSDISGGYICATDLQQILGKTMLAIPMRSNGKILGILSIFKNGGSGPFTESDREIASILTSQASIALDHAELILDHEILFLESLKSLAKIIDERDPYTHGHSHRVSKIAVELGEIMSLSENKLDELTHSGILHDIGKIGIRDEILLKPGALTKEEYEIIKTHPEKGYRILKPIKRLSNVVDAVYTHHEWYNGKGYPRGLKGKEIPLAGTIIAVADAYDTITTDRVYRRRKNHDEAIRILQRFSGIQFNPVVVEAMKNLSSAKLKSFQ